MAEAAAAAAPGSLSLKARVALAVSAVLLAGGAVVLVAALAYGRQAAREAYDRLLLGAASDIAESITVRDGVPLVDVPLSAFQLLALAPDDRIRYRVVGPDGATLTGDDAAPGPAAGSGDATFYDGTFGEEPARYVSVTRRFAERRFSGPVRVIVGQTLLARQSLARDIAQNALFLLGGAGAAMALIAWLAVRSALRPLARIGRALARRDPTDLTPLDLAAPREIAGLLGALNGFMARLDRQAETNRNLIGDAAHQLRNPVAALRAQAQLALDEGDPGRRSEILSRLHDRAVGLGRLLDQMLSKAMVIHRTDTAPRALLDLRDIAVEVLEDSDHDVVAANVDVTLDLPDRPVGVRGDALSLAEAGKNLLGNALRHGRGPVRLGVTAGVRPELWVLDAGAGPPPHVLTAPPARFGSRRDRGGGGLGLAIAQAVAASHGGRLVLRNEPDGFRAALRLQGVEG
ncbi:MAG: sensor histidine kinase N-terminal domain-containing protein [Tranquillimonas sp.]